MAIDAGSEDAGRVDAGQRDGGRGDAGLSDGGSRFACDGVVGLTAPLPVCSTTDVCTRALDGVDLSTRAQVTTCRTRRAGRPLFDDGPPLERQRADGPRQACLFMPPDAGPSSKRPLLIFFPGSGATADSVYDFTSLRSKAESFDLSGEPQRPGFALLSIQSRNLHWPTATNEDGPKHDIYFRDVAAPSTNPDFANVDAWIDELVAAGAIDPSRIYTSGWSNGARFAQAYAIARHDAGTPGNQHIRAAAVFSGTSPYDTPDVSRSPSCQWAAPPRSNVPIFIVSRTCDVLPCDVVQAGVLADAGLEVTPGDVMDDWVRDLRTKVMNSRVTWQRINGQGQLAQTCPSAPLARFCTPGIALLNHVRWPDGVADQGGIDHEPAMLDFLRTAPP